MLTATRTIAGTAVTLYAISPTGPWATDPAHLRAYHERWEMACRGELSTTFDGKPLDTAAKGRDRAMRSRRAKAAHAKRRRVLG